MLFLAWSATTTTLADVLGKVLRSVPDGHHAHVAVGRVYPVDNLGQALEESAFYIPVRSQVRTHSHMRACCSWLLRADGTKVRI